MGCRDVPVGLEGWRLGFRVHLTWPEQTFMGALDLWLGLDLDLRAGLRLKVGLSLWFGLLLLLHEHLVVQKLELGWVPGDQSK